ncbi:MAG: hypothetical protein JWN50_695 [Parcubacteria group bacterium]|nr:hypothetical protein [Parcubacteria group bacterium]
MNKKLVLPTIMGAALLGGMVAGIAGMASAQTTTAATQAITQAATTQADPHAGWKGHAPAGQDGNITAISGSTITVAEEADEGGTVYTVDASGATYSKDGTAATLADLKIGDKIFIDGTVSGTNVTATKISSGHPDHGPRGAAPQAQMN